MMDFTNRERAPPGGAPPRTTPRLTRLIDALCAALGLALLLAVASVQLEPGQQAIVGLASAAVFLIANRFRGRAVSVFLVVLSLAVSLRYIVWRITETLGFSNPLDVLLGAGLALAECYAILVLVLGYVQTLWPLDRKPLPLPDDPAVWPTVDVFIPTYNEPLAVVRATVLSAVALDWPPDKLRVFLLDDGRRPEFAAFAAECGIGYIARTDNRHAKAGNLNHAMTQTDGEFIAVFDCDHIPTRAFLQMTMGWMVAVPRNALVQTPHHFYSPDPFQRNLAAGARVPAEGNMFYGLVQDGNDFWNAAFFCGSCAVLRRAALDEIGGFAVETVTEDAHTMLKLHRRGWDSCYLRLPLAAGLATERLIGHIGQRMRWARGMIQIFRLDNPLRGPGLTLGQRICYLQAMGHFFFALPRVVFLTAPLAFLLLDINVIAASPLAIVSYALPHIFHSVATNSRLQRQHRHSFWSEIYETVLALFLVRVTAATLLSPKGGKFNVTSKGGRLENGYFDLAAVYPNLILAFLLIAGVFRGVASMAFGQPEQLTYEALLLNTIWGSFSLLTVMAALAVGRETRQAREHPLVTAALPVDVYLPDGRVVQGRTQALSLGGGALLVDCPADLLGAGLGDNIPVQLAMQVGDGPVVFPARMMGWEGGVGLASFEPETVGEEAAVVQAVFGRADAWTGWSAYPADQPVASLYRVLVSIGGLFRPSERPNQRPGRSPPPLSPRAPGRRRLAGTAAAVALLLLPAAAQTAPRSAAESRLPTVRPAPPAAEPPPAPLPGLLGIPPAAPLFAPFTMATALPRDSVPPPLPPAPAAISAVPQTDAPAKPPAFAAAEGQTRTVVLSLHQLGAAGPLTLRGTSELQGVQFGVRADEVVTAATLSLSGAMSPAMIPAFSNDTITLNEQYVGTVPMTPGQPRFDHLQFPIDPVFFTDDNRLNIRFTGRYTPDCNDPLSGLLWSTVSDTSTLTLTLERLPPQRDLARLPLPFFDRRENTGLSLPVILPRSPSDESLTAAAVVASWFGQLADYRGARFPVTEAAPGDGNAVLVVTGFDRPAGIPLPPMNGPTLAVIPNPNDPSASLLLVGGRTGAEAVAAATALALGSRTLAGDDATVAPPDAPPRRPYDAPAWIPSDRPVRMGELVDSAVLEGTGYVPGTMRVPFRTAPDLYTWRNRAFAMDVRFRAPPGPVADLAVSRLDVSINNLFLASLPLGSATAGQAPWLSRIINLGVTPPASRVEVPAYNVFGQNDLQFFFDTRPLHRGDCVAIPEDLHEAVDPDSTIDLSNAYRFTELPNLAFFTSSGFPFTRLADLADTAVVLPAQPSAGEMGAFLDLMGRFGSLTGYPVTRVAVVRPAALHDVAGRNLLLLGTLPRLGPAAELLSASPYRLEGGRLQVRLANQLGTVARLFGDPQRAARQDTATALSAISTAAGMAEGSAALVGAQSPLSARRSVVALLGGSSGALQTLVADLRNPDTAPAIAGNLALLNGDRITSYRVGDTYTVGRLPLWIYPSWLLQGEPYGLLGVMVAGCALVAACYFLALRRRAALRTRRP